MLKDILFVWKPNVEDNIGRQREAIGTFVCPCIFSKIVIDDQQDATFLFIYSHSALYVSGDVFAHHQEHLTVFTASVIAHLYCCRLVSWMRWKSCSIISSTWLYLQLLIFSTYVAADWCHGWGGTAVPPHPWHQTAAIKVDNIRSCK
jgi:hypothetical protein